MLAHPHFWWRWGESPCVPDSYGPWSFSGDRAGQHFETKTFAQISSPKLTMSQDVVASFAPATGRDADMLEV
jgi:hypothetical protein